MDSAPYCIWDRYQITLISNLRGIMYESISVFWLVNSHFSAFSLFLLLFCRWLCDGWKLLHLDFIFFPFQKRNQFDILYFSSTETQNFFEHSRYLCFKNTYVEILKSIVYANVHRNRLYLILCVTLQNVSFF